MLVPHAYTFLRFYFRDRPLFCEIRENKVPRIFVRIRYVHLVVKTGTFSTMANPYVECIYTLHSHMYMFMS